MSDPRQLAERARRAADRALLWGMVSIGLSAFALGFALRGILQ